MPTTKPSRNKIKIANPSIENKPRTYLNADTAISDTSFTVLSNSGFTGTNFYVTIGEYGDEKWETKLVSSFNGTTFTVAALTYSHEASDPVTKVDYNQIKFYNMETDTNPAVDAIAIATLDIDGSKLYTEYTYLDPTHIYFCSAYYNSNDDKISAFSERVSSTSFTRKSVKRIIESGLRKAMTKIDDSIEGDLNWDIALEIVQDGIDEIMARKRKWSFLRKSDSSTSTTANTAYVSKPTDLSLLEFIAVNSYKLSWISQNRYVTLTKSGATIPAGQPYHYTEKNNKYYFYPTPAGAYTIDYDYYKTIAVIEDLSTEIDNVFVPILIYYCASQFAYIRGNDKRGDKVYAMFEKLLEQQVIEYSGPDQIGDAEEVERTSFISTEYDSDVLN